MTSCSAAGWEQYGRRFVETYARHWPAEMPLYLVSEDDLPHAQGVSMQLSLLAHAPAAAFIERHRENARAHGRVRLPGDVGWSESKIAAGYNFRYDAFRFSKKVFAIPCSRGN